MTAPTSKGRIVYSTDALPPKPERAPAVQAPVQQQTVYVERSRRQRAGKTVTIISGLQHSPVALEKMLKEFKTLCGAGGTLKEGQLEIQGDHRDILLDKLRKLGYQAKQKGG